jgi:hypothetical protein
MKDSIPIHRRFIGALVLMFMVGSTACSPKPVLYPNAHLQEVGKDAAKQDIADCRAVAKEAGSSSGAGQAGTVAGHTAVGAGTGAAGGAAGGAIVGSAGIGAAIGAVSGAVYGLLGGLFSGSQPDQAHVNIVNRCLSERGYEVAGWK